jgi:hypothetical protein
LYKWPEKDPTKWFAEHIRKISISRTMEKV